MFVKNVKELPENIIEPHQTSKLVRHKYATVLVQTTYTVMYNEEPSSPSLGNILVISDYDAYTIIYN